LGDGNNIHLTLEGQFNQNGSMPFFNLSISPSVMLPL
jgi:hypothetical protein